MAYEMESAVCPSRHGRGPTVASVAYLRTRSGFSESVCAHEWIQRLTGMFRRISGDRIGLARGWEHVRRRG